MFPFPPARYNYIQPQQVHFTKLSYLPSFRTALKYISGGAATCGKESIALFRHSSNTKCSFSPQGSAGQPAGTPGGGTLGTPEGEQMLSLPGVKCKCSRKGPKIRFSNVRKLEIKPRYPFCVEEMIM